MLIKVDTVRTTCTTEELCRAFIISWQKMFGTTPSKESIGVIVAQHNLETGSGNSCWNFNIANYKAKDDGVNQIKYCALAGVWEIVNGKRVELKSTDPGSWFRAFDTLQDGSDFYFKAINGNRYKSSWSAVEAGNPAAFGHLLKIHGYYTAPESDYVNGLNYHFNAFMARKDYEAAISAIHNATVARASSPTILPEPYVEQADEQTKPTTVTIPPHDPLPSIPLHGPKVSGIWTIIQNILKELFKIKF